MKSTLERRILIFSFLALSLTIAVNTGFNVDSFHRSYRDGILRRCETLASGLKQQIEAVINLGIPLSEIAGLSERSQNLVQNDPEISYCIIEDAQGNPIFHSKPPIPENKSVVFKGLLTPDISILESHVLGKIYDVAIPLYDFNDDIIGRVRIGFQQTVLEKLTADHFMRSLLILGGAFLVVLALIILFARYSLVQPIQQLCGIAREISDGNFEVIPPKMKATEFSILAESFVEMANSLRHRDLKIQESYSELEETNVELKLSYESQEQISAELARSREMYRSLLDDASDAILVCDENDDLILINKIAESFFGTNRKSIVGRNYFSFLESIQCQNIEGHYERHQELLPGKPEQSEIRFFRLNDHQKRLGWATSSAILGNDNKRFVQIIVRDATHEEEIRNNLEKTASEMARLNQMKNSFLGLASHELKTPLTIILGYVELLQSEMADQLNENIQEMIRHIAKAGDRLSDIVRDMVDVSLLDSQSIDLVSKPVNINELIQQAADTVRPYVKQRNQYLHFGLADDLPLIKCDVTRIVQALVNVINNAIKFTPDSGHITIQTRKVKRSRLPRKLSQNGNDHTCHLSHKAYPYIEISIADTGIGIEEAEQEAIFDKFYEVGEVEEHSTGSVAFKGRGAGLGLTIVKGVVDLHGGTVWVESPGHDTKKMPGSTFFILLPVEHE
ncbi:MAG: PAS domain S-box protein [Deltaproteobacteria bacterium]|jgi:PAS domain S-box-containing protein|nr:PAS domain S-box protein [Deltaproteobacteria bacterium]